jgi:hypothetical protein
LLAVCVGQPHAFRAPVQVVTPTLVVEVSIAFYCALRTLFYLWVDSYLRSILFNGLVLWKSTFSNGLPIVLPRLQSSMSLSVLFRLAVRSWGVKEVVKILLASLQERKTGCSSPCRCRVRIDFCW